LGRHHSSIVILTIVADSYDEAMRVFVTGGTGLIGVRLIRALRKRGDEVVALSRQPHAWELVGPDVSVVVGDPTQPGDWQTSAAGCDAIVNLAGANIFGKRWDAAYKQVMRDSRLRATANVVQVLTQSPMRPTGEPNVLVNASAVGYYGPHGDEAINENSPPGEDFLARVCREWEAAAREAESAGVRVALLRIGVVLDPRGGALKLLLPIFKLGGGGPVGSGKQYMSWIHHADLIGIFLMAIDHADARGPLNGVAPAPVTNKAFAKALGGALGRPAFIPTPAFGLKMLLGEVAEVVTTGQRVVPEKALALGYEFQFPEIAGALKQMVGHG
jgi:uncharacterized protein (TIGR01777 family)